MILYNRKPKRPTKPLRPDFVLLDSIPSPNTYTDFIDALKAKREEASYQKEPNTAYEIHHIIPLKHNGSDSKDNVISITLEEHKQAHRIIADLTGNIEDKQTADMMSGKKDEELLRQQRQKAAYMSHKVQKATRTGRYSPTFQSERGKLSAAAPSSIAFSTEKAVRLGCLSQKNKEFPFETRFTLSWKKIPVFSIQHCWSSRDILDVVARIDPVIREKSASKNFRLTRIVQSSSASIASWRCEKVGEGPKDVIDYREINYREKENRKSTICKPMVFMDVVEELNDCNYLSPYEIFGDLFGAGCPEGDQNNER